MKPPRVKDQEPLGARASAYFCLVTGTNRCGEGSAGAGSDGTDDACQVPRP